MFVIKKQNKIINNNKFSLKRVFTKYGKHNQQYIVFKCDLELKKRNSENDMYMYTVCLAFNRFKCK